MNNASTPPDLVQHPARGTPTLESARHALEQFLDATSVSSRIVAVHDSDADGVTAAVVWQRAMERLGFTSVSRVIPDRTRDAWSETNRARIMTLAPDALFALDLGSRDQSLMDHVPLCIIDHHRPDGIPEGAVLISAYEWDPIPNTSLIVWDLFRTLVALDDLDWVAAIGVLSDLGDKAPFELLTAVRKKYKLKDLREATTLINAARRATTFDPETATQALLQHTDPASFVNSNSEQVALLRRARIEVAAAFEEAKKAAPVFSGKVALIRVRSSCQVHPLIAQIWRTRLPKYMVFVANETYLPGRVNFSARSSGEVKVLEFLRAIDLEDGEGSLGHGHDHASGGSLPAARWNQLLTVLGFPDTVFAPEG